MCFVLVGARQLQAQGPRAITPCPCCPLLHLLVFFPRRHDRAVHFQYLRSFWCAQVRINVIYCRLSFANAVSILTLAPLCSFGIPGVHLGDDNVSARLFSTTGCHSRLCGTFGTAVWLSACNLSRRVHKGQKKRLEHNTSKDQVIDTLVCNRITILRIITIIAINSILIIGVGI